MTSPKLVLISVIGAGCLVASGVGGYLAVKSGTPASAAPQRTEAGRTLTTPPSATAAPAPESDRLAPDAAGATQPVATPVRRTLPRKSPTASAQVAERAAPDPAPVTPEAEVTATPHPAEIPVSNPEPVAAPLDVTSLATPLPAPIREVTVPRDTVIGIRLETAVSSATAKVEDRVSARVIRDVRVDDLTVVPSGARLEGSVTLVDRGGRFKDRSRIGVQFTTLVVDDARIPIRTEAIFRDGEGPTKEATSKIGASAVVGTILGAVIGGKKGAVVGGTAGAAGGTAAVMAGGRNDAVIAEGASLTVRLADPLVVSLPLP